MVSPLKNALEFFESSYGTTPKRSDRRAPNKFFDNTGLQPNRFDGVLRLSVLNHRKMLLAPAHIVMSGHPLPTRLMVPRPGKGTDCCCATIALSGVRFLSLQKKELPVTS